MLRWGLRVRRELTQQVTVVQGPAVRVETLLQGSGKGSLGWQRVVDREDRDTELLWPVPKVTLRWLNVFVMWLTLGQQQINKAHKQIKRSCSTSWERDVWATKPPPWKWRISQGERGSFWTQGRWLTEMGALSLRKNVCSSSLSCTEKWSRNYKGLRFPIKSVLNR